MQSTQDNEECYPPIGSGCGGTQYPCQGWQSDIASTSSNNLFAGHVGTSNYLFCDGHVKSLRPTATTNASGSGSGTINLWTLDNSPFNAADGAVVAAEMSYTTNKYK